MRWPFRKQPQPAAERKGLIIVREPGDNYPFTAGWNAGALGSEEFTRVTTSSIVQSVLTVTCDAVAEPPLVIIRPDGEKVREHPALDLLALPMAAIPTAPKGMTWTRVLKFLVACRMVDGNAYLLKIRAGGGEYAGTGRVIGYQPLGPWQCEPVPYDGAPGALRAYRIRTSSASPVEVSPDQIVHFADGTDWSNPLKGRSPLKAALAEVATDLEAVDYTYRILRNPALGLLVSPTDPNTSLLEEEAKLLAEHLDQQLGGANRGRSMASTVPLRTERLGQSPQDLALESLLRLPEERITAVFGVPAIVCGLGAGLARSTFANMKEAREAFTETKLGPLWAALSDDLTLQVLADIDSTRGLRLGFDLDGVRALQEDRDALYKRAVDAFKGDVLTRAEAREMLGKDPGPTDSVYFSEIGAQAQGDAVQKAFMERVRLRRLVGAIDDEDDR